MKTRYLKIKQGIAESDCIFEQKTVRGCSFKILISIPKEFECQNIRTNNALRIANYQLQKQIQKDEHVFDRCYRSKEGWDYADN
jgi:hypothetical protein